MVPPSRLLQCSTCCYPAIASGLVNSQFCTDERFCFLNSGELSNFFNDASGQGVFFVGLNTGDEVVLTE